MSNDLKFNTLNRLVVTGMWFVLQVDFLNRKNRKGNLNLNSLRE